MYEACGPVPSSEAVVPSQGDIVSPGAFGNLETFLVVTAGVWHTTGLWWVDTRDAVKHPSAHCTAPQ